MNRIVIFGNSGSGKSTLARHIAQSQSLAHLDLDTLAWLAEVPPQRRDIAESCSLISAFITENSDWVIEGCYGELLRFAALSASELVFLNLPVQQCLENARKRHWEPHKYESKAAQDKNLPMLLDWIEDYAHRDDEFSLAAHTKLFQEFDGKKSMHEQNQAMHR